MLKVGQLAARTGLTVRTLHHYEEMGLLVPSERTESGHRLYARADVERLQRILSLRQLGFALEEIRSCLDQPEFALAEVIRLHLARIQRQVEEGRRLARRLEVMAAQIDAAETVSVDDFLQTIEVMTMYEKYYTPEQMEQLRRRAETVGPERIQQVQEEWARLYADVRAEMDRGTDPADPRLQPLLDKADALVAEFTGGDPGIAASLKNMYEQEGPARASHGFIDPALHEYMAKARAARTNG